MFQMIDDTQNTSIDKKLHEKLLEGRESVYTSHGYPIFIVNGGQNDKPMPRARCGGPRLCPSCKKSVDLFWRALSNTGKHKENNNEKH